VRVVSVGYDQRLSVWEVDCGGQRAEAKWVSGAAVSVSDVGSVDVACMGVSDEVLCCVVGEGVQLFTIANA
jgi:hypothetical protein